MAGGRTTEWRKLPVSLTELCLATTLRCGQSFRWRHCADDSWTCTLRGRIVQLSQDDATHIRYRSIWPKKLNNSVEAPSLPLTPPPSSNVSSDGDATATAAAAAPEDDTGELLKHYLNLGPNLSDLYAQWSASDANFRRKAPKFTGVRILRQDAWEALVGFICSSNNNIKRISQMIEKLCLHYGQYIATLDGQEYHDFPPPSALTGQGVEAHFRELGFGYRAKYIVHTARAVCEKEQQVSGWLDSLRNPESPSFGGSSSTVAEEWRVEGRDGYRQAHEELLVLMGVGAKVADCVCLMGLGWGEAVPVDTHVWQIAQRDYRLGKVSKHASLTKTTYDAIGTHFRKLWGKEAGWAHSVLFTADLSDFADRLKAVPKAKQEKAAKVEEDEAEASEVLATLKATGETPTSVKREHQEDDTQKAGLGLDEVTNARSERAKRRRR